MPLKLSFQHETTRSNAVCSFRLTDIQKAFNGSEFWKTEGTKYSKVTADDVRKMNPHNVAQLCANHET